MKTLYLVRHAKSSWKNTALTDFKRPLNSRGKKDAPLMGKRLKERGILPDMIICSSAKRAKKTARKIAKVLDYPAASIKYEDKLYEATESNIIRLIQKLPNKINKLMIVGHNPEITSLSNRLGDENIYNMPTCGISCIRFAFDQWKKIAIKSGKQIFFDYPKGHS